LALRRPERFEALGRPRPGWWDSIRRDRFFRFVMQRGHSDLGDPPLVERFERYRSMQVRFLALSLVGLGIVGLLVRGAPE
jgi:hypothetical protein